MDDSDHRQQVHQIIKDSKLWYRIGSVVKLYFLLLAALMTSSSWGFDLSMTNSLQSVDHFMDYFGNPQGARLGFYGASASVGGIVATFTSGYLVDKLGRRALCAIGSAIVISMAVMQTFATSFPMFIAGKMILGFGANLQQVGGPVLVVELAHPKSREALSSLYNTSIYIGLIAGAWITVGTFSIDSNWSWKIPCILQVVLPGYQFFMIWLCPESPRWLAAKGRTDEARQILIKYHGDGVYNELVQMEMQEILASLEADKTQIKFNKDGLKSILGSRGNLHRLFISFVTAVASQCAGSGLISSYLPAVLDQIGFESSADKTLINGT
jgi:MFS family permease